MIRDDLSINLIHLVKGENSQQAVATFDKILSDMALLGGAGNVVGDWQCVCFTETPLAHLAQALSLRDAHQIRYFPAGFMVTKQWLFDQGGRPVIYQPNAEYSLLPDTLKWRHVQYDLQDSNIEDLTWEREWRIKTDRLNLIPEDITLICPTRKWIDRLINEHTQRIKGVAFRAAMMDSMVAHWAVERFPWHYVVLEDLGVQMPPDVELPDKTSTGPTGE